MYDYVKENFADEEKFELCTLDKSRRLNSRVVAEEDSANLPQDLEILDILISSKNLLASVSSALVNGKEIQPENPCTQIVPKRKKLKVIRDLPLGCIQRWTSELATGLKHLHLNEICCRDLNPRNIMLGSNGQIQLTYFYNKGNTVLDENAVKYMYTAPEYLKTYESDWWSFGVVLYELLTGHYFATMHPAGINSYFEIQYPLDSELSNEAINLIEGLLNYFPETRFDYQSLCNSKLYQSVNWSYLNTSN